MRALGNFITLGPVSLRVGSKHLAPWGFPRIRIGGLSLWSWTNSGHFVPASYHPRSSITWIWSAWIYRREIAFTAEGRAMLARLYTEGNPNVARPRWWHRFIIPAVNRRGQWTHLVRLPFGAMGIHCQRRMDRR
jgi:hypothetical protein